MREPSPYFKTYSYEPQQAIVEDLIEQAIVQRGLSAYYLPRVAVDRDIEFGDDILSKFEDALIIEVYPKDVDQWGGEGDTLSKWGVNIPDQLILTVSRRRWDSYRQPSLRTEDGATILLENTAPWSGYKSGVVLLEAANAGTIASAVPVRPNEGDLIYIPLFGKLFVIRFVEHEKMFYQFGKLMTYDIKCELFDYNNEDLATGITEIDSIESQFSMNKLDHHVLLEDGSDLLNEDGEVILLESAIQPEDTNPFATNTLLDESGNKQLIWVDDPHPFARGRKKI